MTEQTCSLHNIPLVEGVAPILYGTFIPNSEHQATEVSSHPFANSVVRRPCWVENETHAKVIYCPACREAWSKTPAAHQLTDYFAREQASPAYEIAQLLAQQASNRKYALVHNITRVAVYAALGSACGGLGSFVSGWGLLVLPTAGAIGGTMVAFLTSIGRRDG